MPETYRDIPLTPPSTAPHQATRIDAELSMAVLRECREKFPAWRDADEFRLL